MSDDGWPRGSSRYESQGHYASADALDDAPLLGDYELPICHHEYEANGTDQPQPWHCHWRGTEIPPAVPQLVAALSLCCFFMVCEVVGGYLAGSLAVMCDAVHLLSDCAGFGLALLAFRLADKLPDRRMSYGYRRAEVLGALSSVLLLWTLTGVFVYVACARLYSGEYAVEPDAMLLVSALGVLVNVATALVLHGCCSGVAHLHSHGGAHHAHAHGGEGVAERPRDGPHANGVVAGDISLKEVAANSVHTPARERNINVRAALAHVVGDLIQSVGVLVAAAIIKVAPAYAWMDPACTFVFGALVLLSTTRVVRDTVHVLAQAVPSTCRLRACGAALAAVRGVRGVHDLHAWALSTHHNVLTAHVVCDEQADAEGVLRRCVALARAHGADSVTIQVERYHDGMAACAECGVHVD